MPKFIDITINKEYLYYYIKMTFDNEYIKNNTNGSVLGHLRMETILDTKINVHLVLEYLAFFIAFQHDRF
jgi:restriction endonuclease S subunit